MGFLDNLFGRKAEKLPPDQLRDALIEAGAANRQKRLKELLAAQLQDIQDHCASWTKPPKELLSDQAALNRYVNGLIGVAVALAKHGHPRLFELLQGGGSEGNPMERWGDVLKQAQSLMSDGEYEQARSVLENHLIDSRQLAGPGAERFRSISYGMISQCRFHFGDVDAAVAPAETAIQICEKAGDLEGVHAYLQTLLEIRRYQGQAVEAGALAERLAAVAARRGQEAESQEWRRFSARLRVGEPLCRVVIVIDGRRWEVDEAPAVNEGNLRFEFQRNRRSPGRCTNLLQKGKDLGSQGQTEEALALFREAASVDAFDPDPHYQAGVALMVLGRPADAAEEFRATEQRAPGWFHCRTDLWLAEQIALGQFPQDSFEALRALEDAPLDPREKVSLAERAVTQWPALAPLHLEHGEILEAVGQNDQAGLAFRRGLENAREPDVRTRLLVRIAMSLPEGAERSSLLSEAMALNGNLVAAAMAALFARSTG